MFLRRKKKETKNLITSARLKYKNHPEMTVEASCRKLIKGKTIKHTLYHIYKAITTFFIMIKSRGNKKKENLNWDTEKYLFYNVSKWDDW